MRIAIVGPESSGKSTLAQDLSMALSAPWVAEYVREYFAQKGSNDYQLSDIIAIAQGQLAAEAACGDAPLLICDTTALVCRIWAEVRYGHCPNALTTLYRPQDYAIHLLTRPDIPWEPDPLRENPNDRDQLFDLYEADLKASGANYTVVAGARAVRLTMAQEAIRALKETD
ncbi:AAA family ATPase [Iodobacter fluviatilis]|uniref:Bifunctional DNA-binding transcriptional repressor/ NMN adenylyltransferase n=1 Tax=Iodobacter fluviatilis TaxID=537 RepID=A0A377Q8I9_9NEIS|nr:ATP-binding protein [Iodobacter fluviatilis]TCU89656.1 NadR type nicotinamide-nucleotide adenylyltransferase [Iodobacter fluviatilis]STQ91028.1 bifunctional DNA-binding transcriptional repressor/ NMN adenylyltransferase [Iodobacter fluviatilis]